MPWFGEKAEMIAIRPKQKWPLKEPSGTPTRCEPSDGKARGCNKRDLTLRGLGTSCGIAFLHTSFPQRQLTFEVELRAFFTALAGHIDRPNDPAGAPMTVTLCFKESPVLLAGGALPGHAAAAFACRQSISAAAHHAISAIPS
jgi:hypothetical protein